MRREPLVPGRARRRDKVAARQRWESFAMLWMRIGAWRRAVVMHLRREHALELIDLRRRTYLLLDDGKRFDIGDGMLLQSLEAVIHRATFRINRFVDRMREDYLEAAYTEDKTIESTADRLMLETLGEPGALQRTGWGDVDLERGRVAKRQKPGRERRLERTRASRAAELDGALAAAKSKLARLRRQPYPEHVFARAEQEISRIEKTIATLKRSKSKRKH